MQETNMATKQLIDGSVHGSTLGDDTKHNDSNNRSILADTSWIALVVDDCVVDVASKEVLKKDLEWYVKEREKKGANNPEYAELYADRCNSAVIDRVRSFLENQKNHPTEKQLKYHPEKVKVYEEIDIETIVQWLKSRFEG